MIINKKWLEQRRTDPQFIKWWVDNSLNKRNIDETLIVVGDNGNDYFGRGTALFYALKLKVTKGRGGTVLKIAHPNGSVNRYIPNTKGLIAEIWPNENRAKRSVYTYDDKDRVICAKDYKQAAVRYTYIKNTDNIHTCETGIHFKAYDYDKRGNRIKCYHTVDDKDHHTYEYVFDDNGNIIEGKFEGEVVVRYEHVITDNSYSIFKLGNNGSEDTLLHIPFKV